MPLRKSKITNIPLTSMSTTGAVGLVPLGTPPGAAATSNVLGISNKLQLANNWCWAACCDMLFTSMGLAGAPSQCQMAATELSQPPGTCCANPVPLSCDKPAWPDVTYTLQGVPFTHLTHQTSFVDVQNEINADKPVEAYLEWSAGGAHVVMVIGWYNDMGIDEVEVNDPAGGGGRILYSELQSAYGSGSWDETYTFS